MRNRLGFLEGLMLLVVPLAHVGASRCARADIYQWEYINPANPSLGRQQSTTLTPDGAGVSAGQGVDLSNRNLTKAYLSGADLHLLVEFDSEGETIGYVPANLDNTNLSHAELPNARFNGATLNNANFSHANLTNANFSDFGIFGTSLIGANLRYANLSEGNFNGTTLTDADLTGAEVQGATFVPYNGDGGITPAQLYATASYARRDLRGIGLYSYDSGFMGVDLAGQNLTNAGLSGSNLAGADFSQATLVNANFVGETILAGANLSHANLANASFQGADVCDEFVCAEYPGAYLSNANLSGADARGANFFLAILDGANTTNLIQSNGHIAGLNLTGNASLTIRDYDGNPAASPPIALLPIVVEHQLAMSGSGVLQLVFEQDPWDSTISFAPGISITRGGTLELTFAPDVNLASQIGRTLHLFDWSGASPTGTFDISSPYVWNLSNLYTTGEVTLLSVGLPGDFDLDGDVDGRDFLTWQRNPWIANLADWQANYGAGSLAEYATVPEPAALALACEALMALGVCRRIARAKSASDWR